MNNYNEFMKQVFDYWFALDDPEVGVRELEGILRSVMGGNPRVCTLAGDCIGENYHIEPNGDVYHCDRYLGDPSYHVGNIVRDSFESIGRSPKHLDLVAGEKRNTRRCPAAPTTRCATVAVPTTATSPSGTAPRSPAAAATVQSHRPHPSGGDPPHRTAADR
jgi:radical SAM protein with 4Fe4S-binding SPASM domain